MSSFPFVNRAKLTFSCNVVPEVYEDTTAFFRRWIIIQFPHTFDSAKADKDLPKKLTTAEEFSGILNFALEGLNRLRYSPLAEPPGFKHPCVICDWGFFSTGKFLSLKQHQLVVQFVCVMLYVVVHTKYNPVGRHYQG